MQNYVSSFLNFNFRNNNNNKKIDREKDVPYIMRPKQNFWRNTGESEVIESESHSVVANSLRHHGLYSPWNSPGQNTEVGSVLFSEGSSKPRDQTQVSHTAARFFTSWATREAQE